MADKNELAPSIEKKIYYAPLDGGPELYVLPRKRLQ